MAKGGSFEREVNRLLSLWWSNNERDDIFGRTDASGARHTSRRKKGKKTAYQSGDITFRDPEGKPLIDFANVETKSGYSTKTKRKDGSIFFREWSLLDILDGSKDKEVFLSFWEQTVKDADGREPILIFRRSGRKICIAIRYKLYKELLFFYGKPSTYPSIVLNIPDVGDFFIMGLYHFTEWIHDPGAFVSEQLRISQNRPRLIRKS